MIHFSLVVRHANALATLSCSLALACQGAAGADTDPTSGLLPPSTSTAETPFSPLAAPRGLDARRVALGQRLFVDPILSGDGKVACIDCHYFDRGGSDGIARPKLDARPEGVVNAPSIFNLAYLYRYNWSARFDNLASQLDANLKNPLTMASSIDAVVARLGASLAYRAAFDSAYSVGLTPASVRDAIITYVLSLVTVNAPFDRYLRGDARALSADEREGYGLFKSYGCASCHAGAAVGGNMVERFGVMRDYFADRGHVADADLGHFIATHDDRDRFVFRVPSLRNVALTAPYFHDGSARTLDAAIEVMATYQLGRPIERTERLLIAAFLRSLTGEIPAAPAGRP